MKRRLIESGTVTVGIFCLLVMVSCSKDRQQEVSRRIVDKISQLKEFKSEKKRIDSLKHTGHKVDITVTIIEESFHPGDLGKDISIAFINEDRGFDETMLYEIRFDKNTEEILSVTSND